MPPQACGDFSVSAAVQPHIVYSLPARLCTIPLRDSGIHRKSRSSCRPDLDATYPTFICFSWCTDTQTIGLCIYPGPSSQPLWSGTDTPACHQYSQCCHFPPIRVVAVHHSRQQSLTMAKDRQAYDHHDWCKIAVLSDRNTGRRINRIPSYRRRTTVPAPAQGSSRQRPKPCRP